MLIVLDPGHGGIDQGASGQGLIEKNLNWDMTNKLKTVLADHDVEVVIVQPSCENPNSTGKDELYLPPARANELKADLYISLHTDAGGGTGFSSYVHPAATGKEADRIRGTIHFHAMKYLAGYGVKDRGKKYANFAVLRLTDMPAVLLEDLFVDHPGDAALLKDPLFRWGLALAEARGIVQAMGIKPR